MTDIEKQNYIQEIIKQLMLDNPLATEDYCRKIAGMVLEAKLDWDNSNKKESI